MNWSETLRKDLEKLDDVAMQLRKDTEVLKKMAANARERRAHGIRASQPEEFRKSLAELYAKIGPRPQSARLAVDEFMFLVMANGEWVSCEHVCAGSTELRGHEMTFPRGDGAERRIFSGSYVPSGKSFVADMLFSVPEGATGFRLLILGATPVPVRLVK